MGIVYNLTDKRQTRQSVIFSLIFLCSLAFALPALADPLPPSSQAGVEESRTQGELEMQKKMLEKKKKVTAPIEIEKEKPKEAPPAGPAFMLKEVVITGNTVFTSDELKPFYEPFLNKEVTFADLDAAVEKIKTKYKEKGYLTTMVFIPEQDVTGGKVGITVVEGRLGEVKVEGGGGWFSKNLIQRYIHTKKNDVLNIFSLQRDLLRLNQNSDLEVKSVISAGKEPGTTDLVLTVVDKWPYHFGTSVDTQGSRLTGKYRNSLSFRNSNLSGHFDSLFFTTIISALSQGTFASYTVPVDTRGTKVGFDAAVFTNQLGMEYKGADITGETQVYTPRVSGEIYLSDDFQVNTDAGLEIKSNKKYVIGSVTSDDQLRLPYVGFDISKMDTLFGGGQTSFSPKFVFSTAHFLGASKSGHPTASRDGTGGFFFKYEQGLSRTQRMPFESYLSLRTQFQVTSNSLPSSEQFQLGGANSIRGYPEGEYICDFGGQLNADWVFPMYIIPKSWVLPGTDTPLRQQLQPILFVDVGGGKILKVQPGEHKHRFLMGLGGGIKYQYNRNIFLRLEWAEAIGDRITPNQGPSSYNLSIQYEI